LLLLFLALASMWSSRGGLGLTFGIGVLTALTVLSHNVTLAVFAVAFGASLVAYALGQVPARLVLRSGIAVAFGGLTYAFYLRPLVQGWSSTVNPTPVFVSFVAHAGVPAIALAFLGAWLSLVRWRETGAMLWWALTLAGGFCVLQVGSITWNPRYFLFFLPAVWVLAAYAIAFVARRVGYGSSGAAWCGAVALLFVPGMLSHLNDGSRHDYRRAAAVLVEHVQNGQPILSDDAETLSYYLPEDLRQRLRVRTRVSTFPESEFFVVFRSSSWAPVRLGALRRRPLEELEIIRRRRYDAFSHVLYVYRVGPERE
jgi:hypothetical protein